MPYTRFGLEGYGVRRAGSFAGKTAAPEYGPHPVGILTRFGIDAYGVRRAGSFAGKTEEVVIPPVVSPDTGWTGGPGWNLFHPPSVRKRKRDTLEDELRALIYGETDETPEDMADKAGDVREVSRRIIASAPMADSPELAFLAHALRRIQFIEADVAAYMRAVRDALERAERMDADDMEAFMLIARLS